MEPLYPFDRAALRVALEYSGGRPGPMLKFAHDLIEEGARNCWTRIGDQDARQIIEAASDVPQAPKPLRRRGIGAID